MGILSLKYLIFAAAVFLLYYICPLKLRRWVLLAASLVFYAMSGPESFLCMLALTAITYAGGRAISDCSPRTGRRVLYLSVTLVLGTMAVLKYADALCAVSGLAPLDPIQPLGLSWISFQSAGYVIDVSRGRVKAERNFGSYLLFVTFFPQLSQGPISSFGQLSPQLNEGHRLEPAAVAMGVQLMLWGLFKKLVLADRLAPFTAYLLDGLPKPGYLILLGAGVYLIRLYADFSGAMDLIRGTAMLFGITMEQNFRFPLFSLSVGDFWRRWHITLGVWFRTYLLYPFTLSRFGGWLSATGTKLFGRKTGRVLPAAAGTVLVFLLIGLWHGAYWNAVLYGLYFGLLTAGAMLSDAPLRRLKKKLSVRDGHPAWKVFCLLRTWILLIIAQFFAFSNTPAQAFSLIRQSFCGWELPCLPELLSIMSPLEWSIALTAGAILLAVDVLCFRGRDLNRRLAVCFFPIRWTVLLALILSVVVFGCYGDGMSSAAFVYTQF